MKTCEYIDPFGTVNIDFDFVFFRNYSLYLCSRARTLALGGKSGNLAFLGTFTEWCFDMCLLMLIVELPLQAITFPHPSHKHFR